MTYEEAHSLLDYPFKLLIYVLGLSVSVFFFGTWKHPKVKLNKNCSEYVLLRNTEQTTVHLGDYVQQIQRISHLQCVAIQFANIVHSEYPVIRRL